MTQPIGSVCSLRIDFRPRPGWGPAPPSHPRHLHCCHLSAPLQAVSEPLPQKTTYYVVTRILGCTGGNGINCSAKTT